MIIKPALVELLNTTGVVSKEAVLTCKASGQPLPEVTFVKDGTAEAYVRGEQADDSRIILDMTREGEFAEAKLVIRDVRRSDDGLYACIAKNAGHSTLLL